jgi:AcrR family transcriptional regulator
MAGGARMTKGSARERILDIAEAAVLAKGFGATSIEEIIAELGITKSGFFYHFPDKNALARGLLVRYTERVDQLLEGVFGEARALTSDPLERLLLGLTLFADRMAALPKGHPGCLVTSMSYQDRLFDREVRGLVAQSVVDWNGYFTSMLNDILAVYQPHQPIEPERFARHICCAIDGGIIMAKTLGRPEILPDQMLMARDHVRMLFEPAMAMRAAA